MGDCLFCRIATHQVPAQIVEETEELVAFRDINPQAPTHLLIIPKALVAAISDVTDATAPLVTKAVLLANRLATQEGISEGYRLVINCGAQAGQSVWHLNLHLLGGRPMRWPPG